MVNLQDTNEPVAWAIYDTAHGGSRHLHWHEQHDPTGDANTYKAVPLYAAPIAQTASQPEQSRVDTFELPELGRGLNPLDASAHWITAYRAATGLTLAEAREEGRRRRAALSSQGGEA